MGTWWLHAESGGRLLFCENETNAERLWGEPSSTPYPKDGINRCVVDGDLDAVNPEHTGTKVAAHVRLLVPAGGSVNYRIRLSAGDPLPDPFGDADLTVTRRRAEADEFYASITPPSVSADAAAVMRQALAGMLWSKQCYYFDVDQWLRERHTHPLRAPGGNDNQRADRLLSWSWTSPDQRHLVVVNLSDEAADGMVEWPWQGDVGAALVLIDRMTGERYERDGDDVATNGLYVSLAGPGQHVFAVSRV